MQFLKRAKVTRLNWDSNFFNYTIGSCTIRDGEQILDLDPKFDLIYVYSNYPLSPEKYPHYIDRKIVYKKVIEKQKKNSHPNIRIYNGELNQDLIDLSIQSGEFSRFKLDAKLSHQFKRLYTEWIKNSINGQLADYVIVCELDNRIIGFLTLRKINSTYEIGLLSVSEDWRGKGIGSSLLEYAYQRIVPGMNLQVATQFDNKPACKFYEKQGFTKHSHTYIYHLWN